MSYQGIQKLQDYQTKEQQRREGCAGTLWGRVLNAARNMFSSWNTDMDGCVPLGASEPESKAAFGERLSPWSLHPQEWEHSTQLTETCGGTHDSRTVREGNAVLDEWASG